VVEGTVETVQPYGAFIHLDSGITGLLHISEIRRERVISVEKILRQGDRVKAMVRGVEHRPVS
jgi:small subunit ribosomal protein S1